MSKLSKQIILTVGAFVIGCTALNTANSALLATGTYQQGNFSAKFVPTMDDGISQVFGLAFMQGQRKYSPGFLQLRFDASTFGSDKLAVEIFDNYTRYSIVIDPNTEDIIVNDKDQNSNAGNQSSNSTNSTDSSNGDSSSNSTNSTNSTDGANQNGTNSTNDTSATNGTSGNSTNSTTGPTSNSTNSTSSTNSTNSTSDLNTTSSNSTGGRMLYRQMQDDNTASTDPSLISPPPTVLALANTLSEFQIDVSTGQILVYRISDTITLIFNSTAQLIRNANSTQGLQLQQVLNSGFLNTNIRPYFATWSRGQIQNAQSNFSIQQFKLSSASINLTDSFQNLSAWTLLSSVQNPFFIFTKDSLISPFTTQNIAIVNGTLQMAVSKNTLATSTQWVVDQAFTSGTLKAQNDQTSVQFSVNFDSVPNSRAQVNAPLSVIYGLSNYSLDVCLKYFNTAQILVSYPVEIFLRQTQFPFLVLTEKVHVTATQDPNCQNVKWNASLIKMDLLNHAEIVFDFSPSSEIEFLQTQNLQGSAISVNQISLQSTKYIAPSPVDVKPVVIKQSTTIDILGGWVESLKLTNIIYGVIIALVIVFFIISLLVFLIYRRKINGVSTKIARIDQEIHQTDKDIQTAINTFSSHQGMREKEKVNKTKQMQIASSIPIVDRKPESRYQSAKKENEFPDMKNYNSSGVKSVNNNGETELYQSVVDADAKFSDINQIEENEEGYNYDDLQYNENKDLENGVSPVSNMKGYNKKHPSSMSHKKVKDSMYTDQESSGFNFGEEMTSQAVINSNRQHIFDQIDHISDDYQSS